MPFLQLSSNMGVQSHIFSERLYRQVCGLQPPVPELKEIAEYDFRQKLEKFNKQSKIQLAQIVDEAQEVVMLGPVRYIRTLERDALVESATKFYLESRIRDALEQFKEGLECLGLLSYMNRHSSLFREVFIYAEKPLLAKDIASLFKAERSPPGTNQSFQKHYKQPESIGHSNT
ncbi:G2/M phase-specific E3 ubiquitin-protein ligase [Oncorhynchus clarkii lewisi]|uniref:G2/M phase-specific E3 ubiquitin-protein ligase n=1 Tax=Oncorhynchus clarkii lewisi TaxID=490388 RepID=UPI0039B97C38